MFTVTKPYLATTIESKLAINRFIINAKSNSNATIPLEDLISTRWEEENRKVAARLLNEVT